MTSSGSNTSLSRKTKAALSVGIGVPLGLVIAADPAAAQFAESDYENVQSDIFGNDFTDDFVSFEPVNFNAVDSDADGFEEVPETAPTSETGFTVANYGTIADADSFHGYDEVGTNVLPASATILGTDRGDIIKVVDNPYNREVFVNDQNYFMHRTPGEGVRIRAGAGDDTILGSEFDDFITGGDGDDVVFAKGGDDRIRTGPGNNIISAGDGDDLVLAEGGDDVIYGDAGHDKLYGEAGDDTIIGGDGNDYLLGMKGDDTLLGDAGADRVSGGDGSDKVAGGDGNDLVYGGNANDELSGGGDDDYLDGGGGNDEVAGGAGFDSVAGGLGDDTLWGGRGNDIVIGGPGVDTINDKLFDSDRIIAEHKDNLNRGPGDRVTIVSPDLDLVQPYLLDHDTISPYDDPASVDADLISFASTETGQRALRRHQANKNKTTIWANDGDSRSGVHGDYGDRRADGFLRPDGSAGPGVDVDIMMSTGHHPRTYLAENRLVTMTHEFVHAYHAANGLYDPGFSVELDANGKPVVDFSTGDWVYTPDRELQAMGLPYDQDGNQQTPPLTATPEKSQISGPKELDPNTEEVVHHDMQAELGLKRSPNYRLSNTRPDTKIKY